MPLFPSRSIYVFPHPYFLMVPVSMQLSLHLEIKKTCMYDRAIESKKGIKE